MGKLPLVAVLAFAACQPMYGAKAPPMTNPKVIPEGKRKIKPDPIAAKPQPIEQCEWRTKALPDATKLSKRETTRSQDAVVRADTKLRGVDTATDVKVK